MSKQSLAYEPFQPGLENESSSSPEKWEQEEEQFRRQRNREELESAREKIQRLMPSFGFRKMSL